MNGPGEIGGVKLTVNGVDAEIEYPAGKEKRFEFSDKAISVYEGEFVIGVKLAAAVKSVEVVLSYQACDERACLPGARKTLKVGRGSANH
jgi:hypothetical protein